MTPSLAAAVDQTRRIDILTQMVLDLYAQNLALKTLISADLVYDAYTTAKASHHARDIVTNTLGREGYDDTPDAEHLHRVALALKNI